LRKIFRGASLAVFLAGLITFAQVLHSTPASQAPGKETGANQVQDKENSANDVEPARAFVMDSVETHVAPNGVASGRVFTTRYVKANGDWRLGPYGFKPEDGPANKGLNFYAGTSDGVVAKRGGSDSLRSVSPSPDQQMVDYFRTHSSLRSNPRFVRTEHLAGLEVYVLRTEFDDSRPEQWVETSYSPMTGRTPLRRIFHFRDGSEMRKEAIRIRFREVPEDLNDDLKELPKQEKKN
jgi:hypothetical protein